MRAPALSVLTWLCLAFVMVPGACDGQSQPDRATRQATPEESEIRSLLYQWMDALVSNDTAARTRIAADDFTLTTHGGRVLSRADVPAHQLKAYKFEEVRVRVYHMDTAVVSARATLTEGSAVTSMQIMQTWIKQSEGWKLVAEQDTRIVSK